MAEKLYVVHVEDNPGDADLMARALRQAGYDVDWQRVETEDEFRRALESSPAVIIADYHLPRFSGLRALELLRQRHPHTPFIVVSGAVGEEKAAEMIRLGADDYLLKDRMARLPAAVRNAVGSERERAAREKAQSELDALGQRLQSVVTAVPDVVWSISIPSLKVLYMSPAARSVFGREPRTFYEHPNLWFSLLHPEDRGRLAVVWQKAEPGDYESEYRITKPSGEMRWVQSRGRFLVDAGGTVVRADGISRDITEIVRLNHALKEREAGLRHAQAMAQLAHVITAADGGFESWSETLTQLVGVDVDLLPRTTRAWLEMLHPKDRDRFRRASVEAARGRKRTDLEYRLQRPDGRSIYVRQIMEPLAHESGESAGLRWFNTLQDITESTIAAERIKRLNRVHAVLSGINSAIVRIREERELFEEACRVAVEAGRFVMAWIGIIDNPASCVRPVSAAGDGVASFLDAAPLTILECAPVGHDLVGQAIGAKALVLSNDVKNDPKRMMHKELDERGINSLAILPLVVNNEAVGVIALYSAEVGFFDDGELRLLSELAGDISYALDHIQKARRLNYVSYYDTLTALPNRTLFAERLKPQLDDARRKQEKVALTIVDVERFKTINDTLGRQAGDALLVELASRIQRCAPASSWSARIGADQIAIVTPAVSSAADLARRSETQHAEVFGPPFTFGATELRVSARLGIALCPDDALDPDGLLRSAEAALKNAKATGERYLFYTQEMTERVAEKLALENKLRQALERDEFVLHYQPKVDAHTRGIVGLEALIRWRSPELGLVSPGKFVPLLEETGLILQVGIWALRRAALDHRRWLEAALAPPRVAVNVSPIQLRQRDFVRVVERAIAEGVAPVSIDLEITESVVMENIQASIEKLGAVRRLGIDIAVDDFGTGYSSLAYLARLPAETLKIDRSFVASMTNDAATMTVVQTIISLAHSLRLKVVAEGVETEEQANILRVNHCDQMQGYLFGRPMPSEEIAALLAA